MLIMVVQKVTLSTTQKAINRAIIVIKKRLAGCGMA